MGFRNPVTTATELDTGGTGPRVVITQDGDPRMGGGVIELYPNSTNVPGLLQVSTDTFGPRVELSSPPNTEGRRSVLALTGTEGTDGEGVFLSSTGAIYLDGPGPVYVKGNPSAQRRVWVFLRSSFTTNASDAFDSTSGTVGLIDGVIANAPAGDYLLTSTLMLYCATGVEGAITLKAGPTLTDLIGTPRCDLVGGPVAPFTFAGIFTHTGGDLRCYSAFQVVTAGATVRCFTNGSAIRAAYLGPRT